MWARRVLFVGWLLLPLACNADAPNTRELPPPVAGASAPPSAAGPSADGLPTGFGEMPTDTLVDLPDEDAGTLPLPTNAAAKPPADPGITFEWTESQPIGTTCEPGEYTGTFSCTLTLQDELAQLLGFTTVLTGPVTLTLQRSMDGEFLEIADGQFDAVVESIIGAHASLRGKLDCRTSQFEAELFDGVWVVGDPAMPFLPGGTLEGHILGTYQDSTLSGMWTIADPALGECVGNWDASWTP
jgi:hypothetical protein